MKWLGTTSQCLNINLNRFCNRKNWNSKVRKQALKQNILFQKGIIGRSINTTKITERTKLRCWNLAGNNIPVENSKQ